MNRPAAEATYIKFDFLCVVLVAPPLLFFLLAGSKICLACSDLYYCYCGCPKAKTSQVTFGQNAFIENLHRA